MRKFNVLHFGTNLRVAGAQMVVSNLVKSLDTAKYYSIIGGLEEGGGLADEMVRAGYEVFILQAKGLFDISAMKRLVGILKEKKIDIIHAHQLHANFYAAIAAKLAGVPVCIVSEHGRYLFEKKSRLRANKVIVRLSDVMITASEDLKRAMVEKAHINEKKIKVIYNGIDLEKFGGSFDIQKTKKSLGIELKTPIIGIIANLVPIKGHEYFLGAFKKVMARFPQAVACVIGEGELKSQLQQLCNDIKINGNVLFLGHRDDIPELLNMLDLFVLSSLSEEIPLALLEAMASRCPVVATNVGGIPEVISSDREGILVPPKDEDALAAAMLRLLESKAEIDSLATNTRKRIVNVFDLKKMVQNIEELYDALMEKKLK